MFVLDEKQTLWSQAVTVGIPVPPVTGPEMLELIIACAYRAVSVT